MWLSLLCRDRDEGADLLPCTQVSIPRGHARYASRTKIDIQSSDNDLVCIASARSQLTTRGAGLPIYPAEDCSVVAQMGGFR